MVLSTNRSQRMNLGSIVLAALPGKVGRRAPHLAYTRSGGGSSVSFRGSCPLFPAVRVWHSIRPKQVRSGGAADGGDRRVLDPPFCRDGVEALHQSFGFADGLRAIAEAHVAFLDRGSREDPGSCLPKRLQQGSILELTDDVRADVAGGEPPLEASSQVGVLGGQQEGRSVQRPWKVLSVLGCQPRAGHQLHPALSKEVTESPDLYPGWDRSV